MPESGRLTKRNERGGITVWDMSAALEKLAALEDAETLIPIAEVNRVLQYGEWRQYFHPPKQSGRPVLERPLDELQRALNFVSALALFKKTR